MVKRPFKHRGPLQKTDEVAPISGDSSTTIKSVKISCNGWGRAMGIPWNCGEPKKIWNNSLKLLFVHLKKRCLNTTVSFDFFNDCILRSFFVISLKYNMLPLQIVSPCLLLLCQFLKLLMPEKWLIFWGYDCDGMPWQEITYFRQLAFIRGNWYIFLFNGRGNLGRVLTYGHIFWTYLLYLMFDELYV